MVRAPAARPHPPLHGQAPARRDRAGRRARLPALPVALAARRGGRAHAGPRCGRGDRRPARGLRGAGRRLGDRAPAGAHRRATSRPGSTTSASPAASPGHASGRGSHAPRAAPRPRRRGRRPPPPRRSPSPLRTTPITLLARRHAALWTSLSGTAAGARPSPRAQAVADCMRAHGASFFDELLEGSGLLRSQLEEALAELVAQGLVTSDSFGGLRALLVPSDRRPGAAAGAGAARWCSAWRTPGAGRSRNRARPAPAGTDAGRARRAPAAAALRRRVLAAARARGRLAAAVARSAARLSPARGARRDPRRPLRRGFPGRAVRAAGRDRRAARGPPPASATTPGSRSPAPTRSTSSAS